MNLISFPPGATESRQEKQCISLL